MGSEGEVMNKCLKITLWIQKIPKDFLKKSIQKHATDLRVEGTAKWMDETSLRIIACGKKDKVDSFLDMLHKEIASLEVDDLQVEPFLKEKEYRGVFRIIE